MFQISNLMIALLLCCAGLSFALSDGDQMVVMVQRHGDRTPIFIPPNYPKEWPQGAGQLTQKGMNQLFEVGDKIKQRFPELPGQYTQGLAHSIASESDRTLQSAQAMLMGLFPPTSKTELGPAIQGLPFGFQPVPVYSIPAETDFLLRGFHNCDKYNNYLKENVYNSEEYNQKALENEDLFDRLSQAFGFEIDMENIFLASDLLICEESHEMGDFRNLGEDTIAQTIALNDWSFAQEFKPSKYSSLIGGELLERIIDDCLSYINGKDETKLHLYTGHDVTLGALLSAMQETVDGVPEFASFIAFVLSKQGNEYFLTVHFDSMEPMPLELCKGHMLEDGSCSFVKFRENATPFLSFDSSKHCDNDVAGEVLVDNEVCVFISVTTVAVCFFVIIILATGAIIIQNRNEIRKRFLVSKDAIASSWRRGSLEEFVLIV